MSDRAIAALLMLAATALCWWNAWSYLQLGELVTKVPGVSITREEHPKRFWTGVIVTAAVGLVPFGLFLAACFA